MTVQLPDLRAVTSSKLARVGWQEGRLYVEFTTGQIWKFGSAENPVSEDIYRGLITAPSKGSYFYPQIFSRFPSVCLTEGTRPPDFLMVASPVYLALLQTRKLLKAKPGMKTKYALWIVCGKTASWKPDTKYRQCMDVLEAAKMDLEGAIELAKERKI